MTEARTDTPLRGPSAAKGTPRPWATLMRRIVSLICAADEGRVPF